MYDSLPQHVLPRNKFTGKERDSESGLDDFDARYYSSSMGRFMTPDWAARPTAVPYVVFGDPQSLNLYGYVRNDPVSRADADGHDLARLCSWDASDAVKMAQGNGGPPEPWTNEGAGNDPEEQQQLSSQSTQAIQQAAKKYGYNAAAFEKAIRAAAAKYGINPNVLVGLASKESSLNPGAPNGGLFQIQPGRAKDLGIATKDIGSADVQIPKVAAALSGALTTFHGSQDLAVASWTLGVGGTRRLFSSGGMQAVRGALLDRNHPSYGRVGPNYIDIVNSFLAP